MRKAVIDVGSNSVLLLVAERQEGVWTPVLEATNVSSLGAGTKSTGLLGEEGMLRTLEALRKMFERARAAGASSIQAGATMAVRIAANRDEFLHRAQAQGTPVFVVSGDQEAEWGFRAVADDPQFQSSDRISIIDPGGHSTELVTAERSPSGWRILYRNSFALGSLGLRGMFDEAESIAGLELLRSVALIDDTIGLCYLPGGAGRAVVLGASGTNLVTIRESMTEWDPARVHGVHLQYEEVGRAAGWLMPMTDGERAAIPGMERGREKTLQWGALILERFLYALRVEGCYVSVRGWRHALLDLEI